jgi:hypothetical protein
MHMQKNIGSTDKIIRIVAGIAILAIGLYYSSWWALLGLIPLVTAGISFCPAYALLGISTLDQAPATPAATPSPTPSAQAEAEAQKAVSAMSGELDLEGPDLVIPGFDSKPEDGPKNY